MLFLYRRKQSNKTQNKTDYNANFQMRDPFLMLGEVHQCLMLNKCFVNVKLELENYFWSNY